MYIYRVATFFTYKEFAPSLRTKTSKSYNYIRKKRVHLAFVVNKSELLKCA